MRPQLLQAISPEDGGPSGFFWSGLSNRAAVRSRIESLTKFATARQRRLSEPDAAASIFIIPPEVTHFSLQNRRDSAMMSVTYRL